MRYQRHEASELAGPLEFEVGGRKKKRVSSDPKVEPLSFQQYDIRVRVEALGLDESLTPCSLLAKPSNSD